MGYQAVERRKYWAIGTSDFEMNAGFTKMNDGRWPDYGKVGHLHDTTLRPLIAGIFEKIITNIDRTNA